MEGGRGERWPCRSSPHAQSTHQCVAAEKAVRPACESRIADTGWGEAIAWTAATGVAIGVARLVAARAAAADWQRATGELPPGLEEVA